jgi:urease accessory protein
MSTSSSAATATVALLLLGDGRFPSGGHVHSGGVEAAVDDGRVLDLATLERFTSGRLRTAGLVDAALAAATTLRLAGGPDLHGDLLAELDAEADARLPVPSLRAASRRQGRQLLRAAGACWSHDLLDLAGRVHAAGIHQAVALGIVAAATGLSPDDAARLALHHAAATATQAAVRLLGLDPFGAAAVCARLAPLTDELAAEATAAAAGPLTELPAGSAPVLELAAVEHAAWDSRMFAT